MASNLSQRFYDSGDSVCFNLDHARSKGCPSRDLFCLRRALLPAVSTGLLRVTDGLSEHIAQLSLRLRRFSREGFLPSGHARYMGMPEGN